jgi:hypothetical protein
MQLYGVTFILDAVMSQEWTPGQPWKGGNGVNGRQFLQDHAYSLGFRRLDAVCVSRWCDEQYREKCLENIQLRKQLKEVRRQNQEMLRELRRVRILAATLHREHAHLTQGSD